MGNKIKPWHQRKPKHHGKNEKRGKRIVPLRAGGDKRIVPLRPGNESYSQEYWDDSDFRS